MIINTTGTIEPLHNASLEALQRICGGYIEALPFSPKADNLQALIMIVNENGLYNELPLNYKASKLLGAVIVGNVAIVQPTKGGYWEALSPALYNEIQAIIKGLTPATI